jgi:DNA-directed RNA polymerase alpha subunit
MLNEIAECEGKFLKIDASENDFIFFIESFGQIKPEVIFTEAVEALDENLNEFEKVAKKIK